MSLSLDFNGGGEGFVESGTCSLGKKSLNSAVARISSHAVRKFKRDSAMPHHQVSRLLCKKKYRCFAKEGTRVHMKLV